MERHQPCAEVVNVHMAKAIIEHEGFERLLIGTEG